ncbi:MAG TPA: dihydrofolate reductase family protein [Pyrinomonadaceae bacterium]|nr:dihydrofolate reductase family protein [Pyrinomonadaceae bacterium]
MRKVTFGGANSLDNYFARKDDAVDWLMWSDEVGEIMADYFRNFDTIVMGRRTYEVAVASGHGGGSYPGIKTYVFSRTLKPRSTKNLEITSEDVAEVVGRLKQEEGKEICIMGGGLLAKSLFEANLIDEVGFNIHPVLLGSGIPLFHEMSHQIDLELIECRALKTGCVLVTYRVKHDMEKKNATASKPKSSAKARQPRKKQDHGVRGNRKAAKRG